RSTTPSGNQPPDCALAIGVESEELGHVPNGCRFRLDLLALAASVARSACRVARAPASRFRSSTSAARGPSSAPPLRIERRWSCRAWQPPRSRCQSGRGAGRGQRPCASAAPTRYTLFAVGFGEVVPELPLCL